MAGASLEGQLSNAKARLALLSLSVGAFALGTSEFSGMSLLPQLADAFSVSDTRAAYIVSMYALGVVVGAPVTAIVCARMPRQLLLFAAMLAFAFGNALSAVAHSFWSLLWFRFLSGFPHGTYLGVAALVAASMAVKERRASAVAMVVLGLTLATIVGVAVTTALGQSFGWSLGFAIPAAIALGAALLILLTIEYVPTRDASPLEELKGLRNRQIWLTLLTGAIGYAGFFAAYAFAASTLINVTGVDRSLVPLMIALFGVGMTVGTLLAGWSADRNLMLTPAIFLSCSALVLVSFTVLAGNVVGISAAMLGIGAFAAIPGTLQTRLMDVAAGAQTSAAALNHSALNVANALGPWLAGVVIAWGHYSFAMAGVVGSVLACSGVLIWIYAWRDAEKARDPREAAR